MAKVSAKNIGAIIANSTATAPSSLRTLRLKSRFAGLRIAAVLILPECILPPAMSPIGFRPNLPSQRELRQNPLWFIVNGDLHINGNH
jgi:hypothetical protein